MSKTFRIVIALIMLMALFACVAATLTIVQVQRGSINAQLAAPTRTALFWQVTNLHRYLSLRAMTPDPHEPQTVELKRYPFTWSTADGFDIPAMPGAVADTLEKFVRAIYRPIPDHTNIREAFVIEYPRPIEDQLWTFAFRRHFGEHDITVTGMVMPSAALTDHYLQSWMDQYPSWDASYQSVRDRYAPYPYTISFVHGDPEKPEIELFKNDKPVTLHGQPIPEDKIAALYIEDEVPFANLGRLRIESYGINDRMTELIVDDMMTIMYVSWAVLAVGILLLIVFRDIRKTEQPQT